MGTGPRTGGGHDHELLCQEAESFLEPRAWTWGAPWDLGGWDIEDGEGLEALEEQEAQSWGRRWADVAPCLLMAVLHPSSQATHGG